ncbi:Murein hydrolase activator NlpD precursor [compost metagenome]
MTGFRGIRFVKDLIKRFKTVSASLTTNEPDKQETLADNTLSKIKKHKWTLAYGISAVTLAGAISFAGHTYVDSHTLEVYHVSIDGQEVGIVSNTQLIEQYKLNREQEVQKNFPNMRISLETDGISLKTERAYNKKTDDQGVIAALNEQIQPQPIGTELRIDGVVVAIVKDQATVDQILEKVKEPFAPKMKMAGRVATLAAAENDIGEAPSELQKVEFVQAVATSDIPIQPNDLGNPDEIVAKLQTGDMKPTKYTVQEGDCVSCIAKKFNTTKQFLYEKNPWIQEDKLKIGDTLDLTVLQPALSVKTTERVVQNQEIQHDTDYVKDDSLRLGVVQPISSGKNGMKQVTFEVTKIDGQLKDESLIHEEIIDQPVTAKVRKGTKVILGEGTGKFSWPVLSASLSSTFGTRWGKLHKGIDITGNKNIMAADNGKVIETGYKSDYGNYIIITHLNGYETLYGHLSKINTSTGKIVEKGEKIGIMGSTGDSTGVHLHFEIHKGGSLENPLKYLNR